MTAPRVARRPGPFGELLRYWRRERGRSQLELATAAGVSPRHLSFVETGRSRPGREMVLRLAETLDVPLRQRNALLAAAGFAPVYPETDLFAPELDAVRRSLEFLLERHRPYPVVLLDRAWNVRLQNRAAVAMLARLLEPDSLAAPVNVMTTLFRDDGLRPFVVNWEEVSRVLVERMHREVLAAPGDPVLRGLLDEMLAAEGVPEGWRAPDLETEPPVVSPIHLRKGDLELRLFSALTTLGTARDLTLHELHLETFLPLDERTAAFFAELDAEEPQPGPPVSSRT